MSRPKPTAGHPSLSDACAALALDGNTSAQVAAKLGIDTSKASALTAYRLGKAGINPGLAQARRLRRPSEAHRRTVPIDEDVLAALQPHAARRGLSVPALVRRLLDVIADDVALVDNVLDDAAEFTAAAGSP